MVLINNAINILLDDEGFEKRVFISASPTLISMGDAFYAADRIPEHTGAHKAVCQFVEFVCENLRPRYQEIPCWFVR